MQRPPLEMSPIKRDALIRTFVDENGRIPQLPAKLSKRLVLLDYVAKSFEVGERYPESQINVILRGFHADYAALRRYLVDEGFLSREAGTYWRTGGTVDVWPPTPTCP